MTAPGISQRDAGPDAADDALQSALDGAIDEVMTGAEASQAPDEILSQDDASRDSDPSEDAAPTDAPPATNAPPEADGTPVTDPPVEDPLAGSEPVTYTVSGQQKATDWAYRFPGEGVMIPETQVPRFQQVLADAEQTATELQTASQTLRQLNAFTASVKDAAGQDQQVAGLDYLQHVHSENAELRAALESVLPYIQNPDLTASLLQLQQDAEGRDRIVSNTKEYELLTAKLQLTMDRARAAAQQQISQTLTQAQQPDPVRPEQVASLAPSLVTQWAQELGGTLTEDQQRLLAMALPANIRKPTAEDIARNPAYAQYPMIATPEFLDELKRVALSNTAKPQGTSVAQQFNQAQLGNRTGKVKPAPVPSQKTKPTPTAKSRSQVDDDLTSATEAALAELGVA